VGDVVPGDDRRAAVVVVDPSPKLCSATAILFGALPPTRSSSVLAPWLTRSSRISGTRSGRASTPRRNDSEVVIVVTRHAACAGAAAAPSATRAAPSAASRDRACRGT
jgi:hypothetical protein